MIQSVSLCAEVTLALHNMNSEGSEGSQQQTRMVHVIDASGKRHCVNAVSGDMFKHIFVRHLTAILLAHGEPLSPGAAVGSPDRITVDSEFKSAIKGRSAVEVQTEMLTRCAVTDIAGTLFTEGITVPRKSCAEFGWVVGIPDKVHTEQHFHVKFEPERRKLATQTPRGEGTIAGSQTVFHRPANSGVYALVCNLELSRIGVNDVTRERVVSSESQRSRQQAAVQALLATLVKPAGAHSNTQSPHILECSGVVATSSSYFPAPMLSPLSAGYRDEIASPRVRLTPSLSMDCRRQWRCLKGFHPHSDPIMATILLNPVPLERPKAAGQRREQPEALEHSQGHRTVAGVRVHSNRPVFVEELPRDVHGG
jgi:CRISPR-associated protein Cst2